jgi:hypothetical protein
MRRGDRHGSCGFRAPCPPAFADGDHQVRRSFAPTIRKEPCRTKSLASSFTRLALPCVRQVRKAHDRYFYNLILYFFARTRARIRISVSSRHNALSGRLRASIQENSNDRPLQTICNLPNMRQVHCDTSTGKYYNTASNSCHTCRI